MAITYTVVCDIYETQQYKTIEAAQRHLGIIEREQLCKHRHHLHSIINGVQAPCVTCDPVLPNLKKGDGHTVCCDALTFDLDGVEHCRACRRPITGRL